MLNNKFEKYTEQIVSSKLKNQIFFILNKFKSNWINQFDFEKLPKKIDKNRLLNYLFDFGKVGYFYIPSLDDWNFFPFQNPNFISNLMDFSSYNIQPQFLNFEKKPIILNQFELEKLPFLFLFKSQITIFELIFSDLKNLAHAYLASFSNRFNSIGQTLIFSENQKFDLNTILAQYDFENLDPIKIIPNGEKWKQDNLKISGNLLDTQKTSSSDNSSSINSDIDKFERRIEETIGIFSSNFSEKSSAQETSEQMIEKFNKTINNVKAITKNVNEGFKNLAKIDSSFADTKIIFAPFLNNKIKAFEKLILNKIVEPGEQNG